MAVSQNRPLCVSVAGVRSHGRGYGPVVSGWAAGNPAVFRWFVDMHAGRDALVCVGGSTAGACCMAPCLRPERQYSRASRISRSSLAGRVKRRRLGMFLRLLTLMIFSLAVCAIAFGYSDNPQNDSRVAATAVLAPPRALPPGTPVGTPQGIYYDIAYVRAPRYGDDTNTRWPEVFDPISMDPGADLVLLHPDGREEVLVPGGDGSIVDPYVSFDGLWIYFAKFHNLQKNKLNMQRRQGGVPVLGSDIYKINVKTREVVRLTFQEWTPNTGVANWSSHPLSASAPGKTYLGYGIFNLGPCPLPGGKVMFTSSRNSFLPNKGYTFPNLQLFVMDENGKNVEHIGHLNLGSALHPTVLADGRVMFSSYETQGLRDKRLWGLWAIWPDGRHW